MLFDVAWKLSRKSLNSGLYDFLSYDLLGRSQVYERPETYKGIFDHYREQGLDFAGKTVIEAGCGKQLFTALHMLAAGASKVLLAEPRLRFSRELLRAHLDAFNPVFRKGQEPLGEEDAASRLEAYRDLSRMPPDLDGTADYLCSYTVLEHVADLPGFFRDSYRLLRPGGRAYHLVDLSDHTYQILARFKATYRFSGSRALYHLRYSESAFARLNDPKCWMNRRLLPEYLDMAQAAGFTVESLVTDPYDGAVVIHPSLLARCRDRIPPAASHQFPPRAGQGEALSPLGCRRA